MKIKTSKFEMNLTERQEKLVKKLVEDNVLLYSEYLEGEYYIIDINDFIFLQYCFEHKIKF